MNARQYEELFKASHGGPMAAYQAAQYRSIAADRLLAKLVAPTYYQSGIIEKGTPKVNLVTTGEFDVYHAARATVDLPEAEVEEIYRSFIAAREAING